MQLRWYAETPARRTRQIVAALTALVVLVLCWWLGNAVHDVTAELAGPGRTLESAGAELADRMDDAGSAAAEVPLVGGELQDALSRGGDAGRSIEAAGIEQQRDVAALATTLGWVTGGVPALVAVTLWLPKRLRFARRAGQASQLRRHDLGLDLFALRALARQPIGALARLPRDPAAGWRNHDPEIIEALAALELRQLGLRPRQSK